MIEESSLCFECMFVLLLDGNIKYEMMHLILKITTSMVVGMFLHKQKLYSSLYLIIYLPYSYSADSLTSHAICFDLYSLFIYQYIQ